MGLDGVWVSLRNEAIFGWIAGIAARKVPSEYRDDRIGTGGFRSRTECEEGRANEHSQQRLGTQTSPASCAHLTDHGIPKIRTDGTFRVVPRLSDQRLTHGPATGDPETRLG